MTRYKQRYEQSGEEMVRTLRKEWYRRELKASNISDALKTSLKQAFWTAIASAKTTGDMNSLSSFGKPWQKQGKITGQDLTDELTATGSKLDEMKDGINSVNEAYKKY